jgi:hypothetical protein
MPALNLCTHSFLLSCHFGECLTFGDGHVLHNCASQPNKKKLNQLLIETLVHATRDNFQEKGEQIVQLITYLEKHPADSMYCLRMLSIFDDNNYKCKIFAKNFVKTMAQEKKKAETTLRIDVNDSKYSDLPELTPKEMRARCRLPVNKEQLLQQRIDD